VQAGLDEADLLFSTYVGRQCIRVFTELGYKVRLLKPRGRPPTKGSNAKDEETLRMARIGRAVRGIINPVVKGEDSP
jgi:hypothetical protein